jgi:outer membrane protein insertion porin family
MLLPKRHLYSLVHILSLFACSLLLFLPAVVAQRSAPLVETVDVLGNRRLTDEEILDHIKVRAGDKFDNAAVEADLKTLRDLGWFDKRQTKVFLEEGLRGGMNVRFMVLELPLVAEISFDGLKYVAEGDIIAELREHVPAFQKGMPYDVTTLRAVLAFVRKYLAMRGFDNATVTFAEEEISATSIKLSLIISETPAEAIR